MSKEITAAEAQDAFWSALKSSNTGLLGLDQPGNHAQPMTAFRDEELGTIWFFSRDDVDLVQDVSAGAKPARFAYGSKDQKIWASIHGTLSVTERNQEIIDRYWNPVLSAWYPDGKDDLHLRLLRFDSAEGRIWISDGGLIKFAYEIAKANLTNTTPDSGDVVDVKL